MTVSHSAPWAALLLLCNTPHSARISEWHADPVGLPDAAGEFLEIDLHASPYTTKSLLLVLDSNSHTLGLPADTCRRLLLGGSDWTNPMSKGTCRAILPTSLPNSRPSHFLLYDSDSILLDSSQVPKPIAGKSWERNFSTLQWDTATSVLGSKDLGTPGACALFSDLACFPSNIHFPTLQPSATGWQVSATEDGTECQMVRQSPTFAELHCCTPSDDHPQDDCRDTIAWTPLQPPLQITELHPAPDDGPEWIEIRNLSGVSLAHSWLSVCGSESADSPDSLLPGQTTILVEDTLEFQARWGSSAQLQIMDLPTLRNTADTLCLCLRNQTVVCQSWPSATIGTSLCGDSTCSRPTPGFTLPSQSTVRWPRRVHHSSQTTLLCPGNCQLEIRTEDNQSLVTARANSGCQAWKPPRVPLPTLLLLKRTCSGQEEGKYGILFP